MRQTCSGTPCGRQVSLDLTLNRRKDYFMIVWLLVGCLFMLMFLRIGLPFGVRTEGNVSAKVALTFRERLLLHRTNMYALGAILVLSAIGQWFPTTIEIVLILVALSIINLPISYLFSSQGIACNNVLFRSWKEFAYVSVRGAQIPCAEPA